MLRTTNEHGASGAHAPLPLSAFLFERTAIFTAAAEYIGDLRDKTGEHGLQHDHRRRQRTTHQHKQTTHIQSGPKKQAVVLQVATSSVMDQFKEIPLLESLVNSQKNACNICHITSKCYHFTLQNGK